MTGTPIQNEPASTVPTVSRKRQFNFLKFLKFGKKSNKLTAANRRHIRHECYCMGTLSVVNRSISLEGIVSEISKQGIKFRPAKTHLLDRKDVQVAIDFAGIHIVGKIAATRTDGYGIALFEDIDDSDIDTIINMQPSALASMNPQAEA